MPVKSPTGRDGAPSHARGVITTVLMIMLAVLIVRDILVRRFGSATQATSDVTQRSR
jgi:hypothetical protein